MSRTPSSTNSHSVHNIFSRSFDICNTLIQLYPHNRIILEQLNDVAQITYTKNEDVNNTVEYYSSNKYINILELIYKKIYCDYIKYHNTTIALDTTPIYTLTQKKVGIPVEYTRFSAITIINSLLTMKETDYLNHAWVSYISGWCYNSVLQLINVYSNIHVHYNNDKRSYPPQKEQKEQIVNIEKNMYRWYPVPINYNLIDLKNSTENNTIYIKKVKEEYVNYKYIPVPHEYAFSCYFDRKEKNTVIRKDLDTNVNNYDDANYNCNDDLSNNELDLCRELFDELHLLKVLYTFSNIVPLIILLDSIKLLDYKLDTTNNIEQLSGIYSYNEDNQFNTNKYMMNDIRKEKKDPNAKIDVRLFCITNLNLNFYKEINTKFIHSDNIKQRKYKLPNDIFLDKLQICEEDEIILQNCKHLKFYHFNNTTTRYYYSFYLTDLYFASDNFIYVYKQYNKQRTLVLWHIDDAFVTYKFIK